MKPNDKKWVRLDWDGKRPVILIFDPEKKIPRDADLRCIAVQVSDEIPEYGVVPHLVKLMKTKRRYFQRITEFFETRSRSYLAKNGITPMHTDFAEVVIVKNDTI